VIPTKAAEQFKVKCDVHPWMSAWVAVFDHPFHGVTGEDGVFAIDTKGLKDGDYDVVVWHEKFKDNAATGKVSVKDGKGTVDLKVKPKAAAAPADQKPAGDKEVLVSTDAKGPTCCTDGSKCGEKAVAAAAKPGEVANGQQPAVRSEPRGGSVRHALARGLTGPPKFQKACAAGPRPLTGTRRSI
jgi:hypothetical protein